MLKHLKFSGAFHDDNLSVNVTLENPADYRFQTTSLLFNVTVNSKCSNSTAPNLEDFTFYVMDEANHLHNTQIIKHPRPIDSGGAAHEILVYTGFKRDFLFQDLRVAVYYHPYQSINIIELRH